MARAGSRHAHRTSRRALAGSTGAGAMRLRKRVRSVGSPPYGPGFLLIAFAAGRAGAAVRLWLRWSGPAPNPLFPNVPLGRGAANLIERLSWSRGSWHFRAVPGLASGMEAVHDTGFLGGSDDVSTFLGRGRSRCCRGRAAVVDCDGRRASAVSPLLTALEWHGSRRWPELTIDGFDFVAYARR